MTPEQRAIAFLAYVIRNGISTSVEDSTLELLSDAKNPSQIKSAMEYYEHEKGDDYDQPTDKIV